ncbi:hypothetical protein Q5P01_000900 [Channa striata]|uniref:Uncharacterized protein n=1 Tax=Channa striata TaxID=64152 RepID=A0AA88ICV0_CHASR|nr:hypothetical protein Q5P01_000900 [Channa striata]
MAVIRRALGPIPPGLETRSRHRSGGLIPACRRRRLLGQIPSGIQDQRLGQRVAQRVFHQGRVNVVSLEQPARPPLRRSRSYHAPSSRHGLVSQNAVEQAPPKPSHWISVRWPRPRGSPWTWTGVCAGGPGGVRSSDLHPDLLRRTLQHAPGGYPGGVASLGGRGTDSCTREGRVPQAVGDHHAGTYHRRTLSLRTARGSSSGTRPGHSEAPPSLSEGQAMAQGLPC